MGGGLETEGSGRGVGDARAHTRACIMCQSTKGGCTFSECNIIALEAGTRMPLNQSRSLGLGLQFHILSPSPPLFFRSLPPSPPPPTPPSPLLYPRYLDSFPSFFARVLLSPCLAHLSCPSRCLFLVTSLLSSPKLYV